MKKATNKRNRGVILTCQGWKNLQSAIQKDTLGKNLTLEELCDRTFLSINTVSKIQGRLEPVDKRSLHSMFDCFNVELSECDYTRPLPKLNSLKVRDNPKHDWGEAPHSSVFYGRSKELRQLEYWVLQEQCRLITILGIGGIGKSSLTVRLGLDIEDEFDLVIWRSLLPAPSVEDKLTSILQSLLYALRKEIVIPRNFDDKLSKLMECLISHRCLLILDNAETILSSNSEIGQYRQGYEGYGQLFKCIGETSHKSCLILTSREKPREIIPLEAEKAKVKSMQLRGLSNSEGRELFEQREFNGTEREWQMLIEHYAGNPLALKIVAAKSQEIFDGEIVRILDYIERGELIFKDICYLFQTQFQRLSMVEENVIYWLAINREPISLAQLTADVAIFVPKRYLPQAITSLLQRSLIEKNGGFFFIQPVVTEYAIQLLIERFFQELLAQNFESLSLFKSHALIKATSPNHIRKVQKRLILQPLLEELLIELGSRNKLEYLLQNLLEQLRYQTAIESGYAVGNIVNLLSCLQVDLRRYDFSNLIIWQAHPHSVNLVEANCQNRAFDC